jgi:hypothetical protein
VAPAKAKFMKEDDQVLGLFYEDEARAYPVKILDYHEIVNDRIGGKPVMVTYCPLSGSAAAFEGLEGGGAVQFGVSGKLLNNNLVMYDRLNGSFWSQLTGEALTGLQTGNVLQSLPVQVMAYKDWVTKYPKTKILSTDTGYDSDYQQYPYGDYLESPAINYPLEHSASLLPLKALVFGVSVGGKFKAYPLTELIKALPGGGELEDKIGDMKVTIGYKDGFFSVAADVKSAGTQESAQSSGKEPLFFRPVFWFAWAAFYPQTEVFTVK